MANSQLEKFNVDAGVDLGRAGTAIVSVAFSLAGMVGTGIDDEVINILTTTLTSLGSGQALAASTVVGTSALVVGYGVNDANYREFGDVQTAIVVAAILMMLAVAFVPFIAAAVVGSAVLGAIVFLVEVVAFAIVAGLHGQGDDDE